MATQDKAAGVKSAYELALERLDRQGIGRPRDEALSDATRQQVAEARSKAQARIAELEILHKDALKREPDPARIRDLESEYRRERQRIEEQLERKVEALRRG
jgi:hypothetical protein